MAKAGFLSTILRWTRRIFIGCVILVLSLVAIGTAYEFYARAKAHEKYPPPGRMVEIGGRRIHLDCRGEGSPTVVLESGLDFYGSLSWEYIQDDLAKRTRTCSYDRAGVLWSDPGATPRDGDAVVRDLEATLAAADIAGPLILVGHSIGGPYIMNYTRRHPDQVLGLVFVDASHPDQLERLPQKAANAAVPFVYKAVAKLSWTGITRLVPDQAGPWVPDRVKAIALAYAGESFPAVLDEWARVPETLHQSGQFRDLGNRPLVVLTAMRPVSEDRLARLDMTREDGAEFRASWKTLHQDEASWSTRSRHQEVNDSGHYIQFERPDLVVQAVSEILCTIRNVSCPSVR